MTFNVCWLKYGDPQADVVIHHKDSTPPRRMPRRELDALATVEGGNLDNISYIEIFDDAEILATSTSSTPPGLDALRKKDSQNTPSTSSSACTPCRHHALHQVDARACST